MTGPNTGRGSAEDADRHARREAVPSTGCRGGSWLSGSQAAGGHDNHVLALVSPPEVGCQAMMSGMLRHEFDFEAPHSAARIWALLHDYDRWTEWSTMVDRVDVLWPGDADHNGRLRRVFYKLPDGQTGSSLELITEAVANRGHTYTMISRDGNDHVGHVRLEPHGPDRTLVHFDEEADLDPVVYAFINRHNEAHLRAASDYLTAHPDYRPDLAEGPSMR